MAMQVEEYAHRLRQLEEEISGIKNVRSEGGLRL